MKLEQYSIKVLVNRDHFEGQLRATLRASIEVQTTGKSIKRPQNILIVNVGTK